MLKHMLTTDCPRRCEYCITKNVHSHQVTELERVERVYAGLVQAGYHELMLTGGEPTRAEKFNQIVQMASTLFDRVEITTQNPGILDSQIANLFDAIVFSLHDDRTADRIDPAKVSCPVYAAVLADKWNEEDMFMLKDRGFAGITINEEQRGTGIPLKDLPLKKYKLERFSIKLNHKGTCLDETIIMPNLDVITNYRKYL